MSPNLFQIPLDSHINKHYYDQKVFFILFLDCTAPFIVGIVTDDSPGDDANDQVEAAAGAVPAMGLKTQRGVCLEYKQIPCN